MAQSIELVEVAFFLCLRIIGEAKINHSVPIVDKNSLCGSRILQQKNMTESVENKGFW